MWKLEHISAINICSFKELEYSPQQGVTTLIFGHNIDNENQQSNGSGKSTLIEVIALGITGSPLRKVRSEEIINDAADECCVQLRFSNTATDEVFIIRREIFRKGSSNVICVIKQEDDMTEVAQASVDAYNKYILDKLGLTRDELFSSFILSKHRYQDFLSSSDKEKKEIINRFSNGVIVDQAIEKIREDMSPVSQQLKESELELAGIDGRIEMLTEQIAQEEETREEKKRSKEEKIAGIRTTIAEKRNQIRDCNDGIAHHNVALGNVKAIDKQVQELENSSKPLDECVKSLSNLLPSILTRPLTDWNKVIADRKKEIEDSGKEIEKWTVIIKNTERKLADARLELSDLKHQHEVFLNHSGLKQEEYEAEMKEFFRRLSAANSLVAELKKHKLDLNGMIESLNAKLAGTITCPACSHQFLVSDKGFDIEAGHVELTKIQADLENTNDALLSNEIEAEKVEQMQTHINNEMRSLESQREEWNMRLAKAERAIQAAEYEMTGNQFNLDSIKQYLTEKQKDIDNIRRKIFDEAFEHIDVALRHNERTVTSHKEEISAAESSIDTLEQTIKELESMTGSQLIASLKESLKSYRKKSSEVLKEKAVVESRLNALNEQEQLFTQFKSYLANTKIQALSAMMNQILADLGSDIKVNFSGYTVLKSGSIREKISVSLIRDGVDCGSFGKFSEGEKMRVNLSSIIAMQRLVNGNCDFGKGLDLLVIDELGDSLDETGLASTFSAINKLGLTALVVSHGLTNEGYPYKLQIVKENGESRIDNR